MNARMFSSEARTAALSGTFLPVSARSWLESAASALQAAASRPLSWRSSTFSSLTVSAFAIPCGSGPSAATSSRARSPAVGSGSGSGGGGASQASPRPLPSRSA